MSIPSEVRIALKKEMGLANWFSLLWSWVLGFFSHQVVWLMIGGAVGTYARYGLSHWFNSQPWGQSFPFGTLLINVSGSFILGIAAMMIPPEYQKWYLLIGTGFCGGYTTFSTFELETFKLVRDGSWWYALANVVGSVVAGFVGVLVAVMIVNLIYPQR